MERLSPAQPRSTCTLLALAGLVAAAQGCSSSAPTGVAVSPDQFVKPAGEIQPAAKPETSTAVAKRPGALRVINTDVSGPFAEADGILDVESEVGVPAWDKYPEQPGYHPKGATFVDAKVGDINNKAIYASEFLELMGARLSAEAAKLKPEAWRQFARQQINDELERMLDDELLRSEALASLKPEQRQGVWAMGESLMEDQRLRAGGSAKLAEQRLYGETGLSPEQYVKDRTNTELISYELQRKIANRVQISRPDLQLAYEKYYDAFNPEPKAYMRQILVPANKTEAIAEIESQLRAGTPFAEVASRPDNEYLASKGGQLDPKLVPDDLKDARLFGIPELNDAARQLSDGEWTGPVAYRTNNGRQVVAFIFLEKVERVATSFYDAQLMIEGRLREFRTAREKSKYIESLKRRASYTPLPEMTARLVAIAEERYGPGAPKR